MTFVRDINNNMKLTKNCLAQSVHSSADGFSNRTGIIVNNNIMFNIILLFFMCVQVLQVLLCIFPYMFIIIFNSCLYIMNKK